MSIVQHENKILGSDGGIRHDGYLGEPLWRQPENYSTYYNAEVDSQCRVN